MKKTIFLLKILILYFYITLSYATGQQSYLNKGIELYKNKQFDQSKVLFERDLVFNPKSEQSYLYLAKIFNQNGTEDQQEINFILVEDRLLNSCDFNSQWRIDREITQKSSNEKIIIYTRI